MKIFSYYKLSVIIALGLEEENYMEILVYIISDADGVGISRLASNTMQKFDIDYKEKTFTNIRTNDDLSTILYQTFALYR